MKCFYTKTILSILAVLVFSTMANAQTTAFTYQGSLSSGGVAANGPHDFEFVLFDSGGTQLGSTITQSGVAVTNGIFSVSLDFGSLFPGAARFLEIRVRASGVGAFTTLSPRQPLTSAPYSIKSLSADNAANAANAVNATNAINAVTATNFTGNLNGDVTGTQSATTVTRLQGRDVANTAPLGGQVLKFKSTTNQWIPDTDIVGSGGGGGTITGVTPGTGLTGGGASGNVTLSIANGGVGTTQLADGGVTDAKVNSVSGSKVTETVANATNASNATTATNATNATNAVNATNATTANGLSASCVGCVTNAQIGSLDGAKVTGTVANAANATNATTAVNFSGVLNGDVTGNQGATTVQRIRNLTVPSPVQADDGKVLRYKNDGVNPAAFELATISAGGGTITGVTTGTGLIGGGTTGNVTVGIAAGGVGTNELANNAVTDAKIAASTITAPKIATGQVVKSLNGLTDNVTLAQGNNITITPSGNTLTIASTSGGVGGSGTVNSIPVWSGGSTTLGTSLITQSAGAVQLPNSVSLAAGAQVNQVQFGSPNSETGMSISGANGRADLRFNGTLKLVNGPGGIPSGTNGIAIDTAGNVGVGTETPQNKLVVNAGGSGGLVNFGAPSGESGMAIIGTNRADVRFDGTTLKLLAGTGPGAMASTNGINIDRSGNVGIGTVSPTARLAVSGAGAYNATGAPRFDLYNTTAGDGYLQNVTDSGAWQLASINSAATRMLIDPPGNVNVYGNVIQPITSNGLVKALIALNPNGTIARCFNAVTNSSAGGCGFSSARASTGVYSINFGFQVDNRFLSSSAVNGNICASPSAGIFNLSGFSVSVGTTCSDGSAADSTVMVIVY